MEQLVLGVLEFNVTVPTAFFFANHFSKVGYLHKVVFVRTLTRFAPSIFLISKLLTYVFLTKDGGLNGQNFVFG